MRILPTSVDTASDEFRDNRDAMRRLERNLQARLELARAGGGEHATRRHRDQGKLTVRDRLSHLLREHMRGPGNNN